MAKDKKRGFFSWLGFGHKDQAQESQPENQEERAGEEQELARPDAVEPHPETPAPEAEAKSEPESPVDSEAFADEVVRVSEQRQHDDAVVEKPSESVETAGQPHLPVAETVDPEPIVEPQLEPSVATQTAVEAQPEPVVAPEPVVEARPEPTVEPETVAERQPEPAVESEPVAEPQPEPVIAPEPVQAPVAQPEKQPAASQEDQWEQLQSLIVEEGVSSAQEDLAESHASDVKPAEHADEANEKDVEPVADRAEAAADVAASAIEAEPVDAHGEETADVADVPVVDAVAEPEPEQDNTAIVEQEKPTKEGFFARLKRSLLKTKQNLGSGFMGLFRGKKIDDELFEELEEQLLIADVGVETTRKIINNLTESASRKQLRDAEALYGLLKDEMSGILSRVDHPLNIEGKTPFVILMVGVNGVGKTTTIGKLARQFEQQGKSVMLAAGDTFRAAAVEQLQVWGQRNNIPVIAQHTGADSASVIFDAIQAAKARGVDVLIADTAGRLQNKSHLMEELKKIVRVMKKLDEEAPHEVMLTIDASTGQNAISQAKLFHEAVGLTGITLTKLDGTAKGGVIFSVADQFGIPIRYIGVGERIEDLRPFNSGDFIEALFARED